MNWFRRTPKVERNAVDDVLELTTKHNLEHHAEEAADKAEKLLGKAVDKELENEENLRSATTRFELSRACRKVKEGLVKSVTSVLTSLRK